MADADNYNLKRLLEKFSENPPESSCVASFDYDLINETLKITFPGKNIVGKRGGSGTWEYYNFPLSEFILFAQASSLGTYFNLYIRGRYSYSRIG